MHDFSSRSGEFRTRRGKWRYDDDEPTSVKRGRRLAGRRGVEVAPLGVPALGHQAEQRALPALTGAGDEDDPGVRQRLGEGRF